MLSLAQEKFDKEAAKNAELFYMKPPPQPEVKEVVILEEDVSEEKLEDTDATLEE